MTNQELEQAKDQLWKFQLRREHAKLLKDMDTHKEAFQAFAEEAKAAQELLKEQITVLKSKFEQLVNDSEKQAQEAKDYRQAVEEKITELEKIKANLKTLGIPVNVLEGRENDAVETAAPITATPAPQVHTSDPTKDCTASASQPTSLQAAANATAKAAPNIANTGLRKSRRQARRAPIPAARPAYAKFPEPPLSQEDASFASYFAAVDGISLRIDPAEHTPLVAMFVTGLAERDQQDAIVGALEAKDMCRVLGDGQVEMKCNWGDLKAALVALKLLAGAEEKRSHKKGKK